MESFWIALKIVAPLFFMMALGYLVKITGIMNETSVKQTNKLIFRIFLPILVFLNIYHTDLQESFDSGLLLYALCGVAVQFIISVCLVLTLEKDNSRRGVMLQGMFRSNFVLFGIPVSTSLYGDHAAGLASILIAVIIPLYNVLAVISLEVFNGRKPSASRLARGVLTNPLIIASALGIFFVSERIKLPEIIHSTLSSLSGIATPLAFVILGASFAFEDLGSRLRPLCITLSSKLVIFPILMITAAVLLGFRAAPLAVLLTVFASPIAVSSFTMAQQMGGDDKLAGQLVVFSSVLSVVTMFLFIFILKELSVL